MTVTVELAIDARADLGEGPVWDGTTATLLFVDSTAGHVYRFDPDTDTTMRVETGLVLGAALPRRAGGWAASSAQGVVSIDPASGATRLLAPIEADRPQSRMNDAKCDSRGRMYAGTLSMPFERGGSALYRIDPDLSVTRLLDGVTVSNGMAWNADETLFYYVDTSTRGIDVFDFDRDYGTISGRRRFATIDRTDGFPDGIAADRDGGVWVALYLGGAVRRYAPDGTLVDQIALPVSAVTSCNFGGTHLSDLYITTARHGVDPDILAREPLAGAVFRCRPGVAGLPTHIFEG